jgi:Cdc6-like AAA superfamily ATPase
MFAPRGNGKPKSLQERVTIALRTRGAHLVLWGFTGVGKTSLLEHCAKELGFLFLKVQARRPLNGGSAIDSLLSNILTDLGYEKAISSTRGKMFGAKASVKASVMGAELTEEQREEVVSAIQAHTLDRAVVTALAASPIRILFIDAFEFIPEAERTEVAEVLHGIMHELSDLSGEDEEMSKIVIAGVASNSKELLPRDPQVRRRVQDINVPPMSEEQLRDILRRGSKLLNVNFSDHAREAIVQASDGFPFYTHHFAFHAVEEARAKSASGQAERITIEDFEVALEEALSQVQLQLTTSYLRAVEPTRSKQLRKRILEALASCPNRVASLSEIRAVYLEKNPDDEGARKSGFFQKPLAELVGQYGILVERRPEGADTPLYGFTDPLMRAYIRLYEKHPELIPIRRDEVFA